MSEGTLAPGGAASPICPTCSVAIHLGDVFCESCGSALHPAEALPPPAPGTAAGHLMVPVAAPLTADTPHPMVEVCDECGGQQFADGFCAACGAKQVTWRDHYREAPARWLGGVCDRGIRHHRNEDAMALNATDPGTAPAVLVVCDGVTTAPDSDRAALAAARAARDRLVSSQPGPANGMAHRVAHWTTELEAACRLANLEAVAVARTLGDPPEPPSCTFVAAVFDRPLLAVAWCGDSRAYWLPDDGSLRQLSVDHSLGTEMIGGGMSRAEAEADPTCHTITRWLGADSVNPTAESMTMQITASGWLLVCSDGLWNYATEAAQLRALLDEHSSVTSPPTAAVDVALALVAWANAQGGHDNVTAALARIEVPAADSALVLPTPAH